MVQVPKNCGWWQVQPAGPPQADYYEVQQSLNGSTWKKLGRVEVTNSQVYTYTNQQPAGGTSYCRLQQTDKTGDTTYSTIETIAFAAQQGGLQAVYPNPFTGAVQLQLQASKTE